MSRCWAYSVLGVLLLATIVQAAIYYPRLPDRMASHFNLAGQADGWMSKPAFFLLSVGMQFGMAILLVGITRLVAWLPDALINLPHKEYWLAPSRRVETFASLERYMVWMAAATTAMMIAVFQLTINANLKNQPLANPPLIVGLVLYLGVILLLVFRLYRRFRLPADELFSAENG